MKYSVIGGRDGFQELQALFAENKRLKVFFRGKETKCLGADDIEGYIEVPVVRGRTILYNADGSIKLRKLQGRVTFEIVEAEHADDKAGIAGPAGAVQEDSGRNDARAEEGNAPEAGGKLGED